MLRLHRRPTVWTPGPWSTHRRKRGTRRRLERGWVTTKASIPWQTSQSHGISAVRQDTPVCQDTAVREDTPAASVTLGTPQDVTRPDREPSGSSPVPPSSAGRDDYVIPCPCRPRPYLKSMSVETQPEPQRTSLCEARVLRPFHPGIRPLLSDRMP